MNVPLSLRRIVKVVEEEWGRFTLHSAEDGAEDGAQDGAQDGAEDGAQDDAQDGAPATAVFVRPPRHSIFPLRNNGSVAKNASEPAEFAGAATVSQQPHEAAVHDFGLSEFRAAQFATVLEDAVVQLHVLVSCNTALYVSKTLADMELLVARKFGVRPPRDTDELARVDPRRLHCDPYKIDKLHTDRNFLEEIFEDVYKNVACKKSYRTLVGRNENIMSSNNYRIYLLESDTKNKMSRRELSKRLRQQRNHIKSATYDADAAIDALRYKIEDVAVDAAVRARYTRGWQRARAERHRHALGAAEGARAVALERHKRDGDREHRVHAEIESLTKIVIDETLREVEVWMEKYDRDIEAIDLQIQKKKADYYTTRDKTLKLEETLAQHASLVAAWVSFKKAREGARVYARTMTDAALVVQAWWRGIIVRRELGPFRPKPKEKDEV